MNSSTGNVFIFCFVYDLVFADPPLFVPFGEQRCGWALKRGREIETAVSEVLGFFQLDIVRLRTSSDLAAYSKKKKTYRIVGDRPTCMSRQTPSHDPL